MLSTARRLQGASLPHAFQRRRTRLMAGWSLLVVVQMLCFLSPQNIVCALLILIGGNLGVLTMGRRDLLRNYPISTLIVLGYTLSYFLLPPVATLLEWKPITHNLNHAELINIHALVCLIFVLGAHVIYRNSRLTASIRKALTLRVLTPLGYFRVPGNTQYMILGGIGLAAMAYQVFVLGSAREELLGADNKFMQAMFPLVYLPYCILIRPVVGARQLRTSLQWKLVLGAYTAALLLVSMGSNSRSAFLLGITSIGIAWLYGVVTGSVTTRLIRARNLILLGGVALILQGPVADLATSMVIVRDERRDLAAAALLEATMNTMQDSRAIAERRQLDNSKSYDWDEYYVDNLFLARLSNLKFSDESLDLALRQDASAKVNLRNLEWQSVLSVFPRPVIDTLGLPVDKELVSTSSGGDLMLFTTTGDYDALRGFRTGSIFGSGYALFGWLYPFLVALAAIPIFTLADTQTTRVPNPDTRPSAPPWIPAFNSFNAVRLFAWLFFLTSAATGVESMAGLSRYIMRGWLETLMIYSMAYWFSYAVVRIVPWRGMRR
ncbi:hypothetical protein [Cupriavidus pauculus]|uniref:O-antigen polysaccharide polymerase Wzy n=1 Tax=Cupriavidus pauculus TaxID=82633 RepID=A0A2N5C4C7_9BURK|nr:hypothetical protein [Cupriavidus pauculus]PLP97069.1 hypothetical protein CYJ10_28705 [Cupriavidus pauculus]